MKLVMTLMAFPDVVIVDRDATGILTNNETRISFSKEFSSSLPIIWERFRRRLLDSH